MVKSTDRLVDLLHLFILHRSIVFFNEEMERRIDDHRVKEARAYRRRDETQQWAEEAYALIPDGPVKDELWSRRPWAK